MGDRMSDYQSIMERRVTWHDSDGFEPVELHEFLFDFQKSLVDYAIKKGRAAIFADCGLGKTAMQLSWADNVSRHTAKPVLIVTPLAVAAQTQRESEKFGIASTVSRDGSFAGDIVITNYERLHHFDRAKFAGVVCDESSAIKNFDGKRKEIVTQFLKDIPYRLLCTATAAPNDFFELGTSSEALGYLGFRDMITTFFVQETSKDGLGWGRTKYRLKGHAEQHFWRWVVSWARAIRKPSDIGFSDDRYELPDLIETEYVVKNSTPRDGLLFAIPARGMREERDERKVTLSERCELMSELSSGSETTVCWCQYNQEGDLLERTIPDAVQVKGSMRDEEKEEKLQAFSDGAIRVLVTKPKIGCWGLNWQHCNRVNTFPSHSFEQYYQAIRRCWRFGQERNVTVGIVSTEGEAGIMANLKEKQVRAEHMFSNLVACMGREIARDACHSFSEKEELPSWL